MLNFHVYLEKHIYCQPRFHPFDRFVSPQLLNWLVFWLVHHTRYRNRVHPLGTLFKVLKTSLLPFIARSIFRFVIFILSKTYFHHKTWLSGHMSTLWASSSHAKVSFESSFSTSARTFPQKGFSPASFSFHPFGRIVSPKQSLNGRIMLLFSFERTHHMNTLYLHGLPLYGLKILIVVWLFNRTDYRNTFYLHGPLYCGTRN